MVLGAAATVERLAGIGADGVQLAVVGQRLDGPVDRREPHRVAVPPQLRMDLLRAVEAVEVLEDRSNGGALTGGAGHASMVTGGHGNVSGPGLPGWTTGGRRVRGDALSCNGGRRGGAGRRRRAAAARAGGPAGLPGRRARSGRRRSA